MASRTALLAYELGAGLGHARPLLRVADGLRARGWAPVLAVRDVVSVGPIAQAAGIPLVQAPVYGRTPAGAPGAFVAARYTDVLATAGFAAQEHLASMVAAWDGLLAALQPAVIVAEHAPTLVVAARERAPVVLLGSGFTLPPIAGATFPELVQGAPATLSDAAALAHVTAVLAARGATPPPTLPQLFATAARQLNVLPQLDPYRASPGRELAGGPLDVELPSPSPRPGARRLFVYLHHGVQHVEALVRLLGQSCAGGDLYVRELALEARARLEPGALRVHDAPLAIAEAVRAADVVVHTGGVGVAQVTLACGRPQLLFPHHLEQLINATGLARLGVARTISGAVTSDAVRAALEALLHDPAIAHASATVAADVAAQVREDPLVAVLAAVEACAAGA